LTVEDWDGAPNERDALLQDIANVNNVVVFTGDLHAFFAGTPHPTGNENARVVEFVSGSVSSSTWLPSIQRVIASDPTVPSGAALLAGLVGTLLQHPESRPNPHMGFFDLQRNGYAVVRAGADELEVSFRTLDDGFVVRQRETIAAITGGFVPFNTVEFRVRAATRDLEQKIDGVFRVWDRETQSFQ
jgi:alkaline phosphatase D